MKELRLDFAQSEELRFFLIGRVSEISVKRIRVNQGVGVCKTKGKKKCLSVC